jgi:hypothetical protein
VFGRAVVTLELQFAIGVLRKHRDSHVVEFTLVPGPPHDIEGRDRVVSIRVPRTRENEGRVGIHGRLLY